MDPETWALIANQYRHLKFRLLFSEQSDRVQWMRWHPVPVSDEAKRPVVLGVVELGDLLRQYRGTFVGQEHNFILNWWKNASDRREDIGKAWPQGDNIRGHHRH